jgi:hypothetical protein
MARAITTNQQINGTTTVAKNLSNFSMAGWIRRPSASTIQGFGFNDSASHVLGIYHFSDNNIYFDIRNGLPTYSYSTRNISGWNHIAMVFNGTLSGDANRCKGYLNGNQISLTFSGNGAIPATTSNNSALESYRIGKISTYWSTGDFAELGMWQASLTAEEVASLAKGMTCEKIRPQSLVFYTPLIREIQDLARGMTLTDTSTTVANHPRVYA